LSLYGMNERRIVAMLAQTFSLLKCASEGRWPRICNQ
jgi:hypothetical protein